MLFSQLKTVERLRAFLSLVFLCALSLLAVPAASCFADNAPDTLKGEEAEHSAEHQYRVGAERPEIYLPLLAAKRVGLVVNQASQTRHGHTIDQLRADGVDIKFLFALEHGVRGTEDAGAVVADGVDPETGIPVRSLYGKSKKPSVEDTGNIDVIVYDVQDVGARFFTYISSLHYLMEACADQAVALVVLDRPNPLGGLVDGPMLDSQFQSFVGMHPIPVLYGMTPGELAQMINGEGWLGEGRKCELTVVPVANYQKGGKVKLVRKPSPNLPNSHAIQLYPSLALFEATDVSIGRGTAFPFQVAGGPDARLGKFNFTPVPTPGMAMNPKHKDTIVWGDDLRHRELNGALDIDYFIKWREAYLAIGRPFLIRPEWLDKLMGTDTFRLMLEEGFTAEQIRASWQPGLEAFRKKRAKYLIYSSQQHRASAH